MPVCPYINSTPPWSKLHCDAQGRRVHPEFGPADPLSHPTTAASTRPLWDSRVCHPTRGMTALLTT